MKTAATTLQQPPKQQSLDPRVRVTLLPQIPPPANKASSELLAVKSWKHKPETRRPAAVKDMRRSIHGKWKKLVLEHNNLPCMKGYRETTTKLCTIDRRRIIEVCQTLSNPSLSC